MISTAQHSQAKAVVSQQFAINHYQQTASAKQQINQNAGSKEAAISDRVELSVNSQYTANRILEEIAARVTEKFGVDAAAQIQFNPNLDTSSEATAERIFTFLSELPVDSTWVKTKTKP